MCSRFLVNGLLFVSSGIWIFKQQISTKMVKSRDLAGNTQEAEEEDGQQEQEQEENQPLCLFFFALM